MNDRIHLGTMTRYQTQCCQPCTSCHSNRGVIPSFAPMTWERQAPTCVTIQKRHRFANAESRPTSMESPTHGTTIPNTHSGPGGVNTPACTVAITNTHEQTQRQEADTHVCTSTTRSLMW